MTNKVLAIIVAILAFASAASIVGNAQTGLLAAGQILGNPTATPATARPMPLANGSTGAIQVASSTGILADGKIAIDANAVMNVTLTGGPGGSANGPIIGAGLTYNPVLSVAPLVSGTYDSATGHVSLTVGAFSPPLAIPLAPGQIVVPALTTTPPNQFNQNQNFTTTAGTGGTTINFTAASGLGVVTLTGGGVNQGYTHSVVVGGGTVLNSGVSALGFGLNMLGHTCTGMGFAVICGEGGGIALGIGSNVDNSGIGIGGVATNGGISIGQATTTASNSVAISNGANDGGFTNSVCIGKLCTNTAVNQAIIGASTAGDFYVAAAPTPAGVTIHTGNYLKWDATPLVVGSLPTCTAGTKGNMAIVSDATAPTYRGALTGGGGVIVPVFCDGTAWLSH